ncbi:MAG: DUF4389 domain-containing protein [bacterium]|nr:DUF4389 domain-containing protein [bacterium]
MSDSQTMTSDMSEAYPARLDVDYPEEGLSRVKTLFRIVLIIPIAIVAGLITGYFGTVGLDDNEGWRELVAGGVLFVPTLLMILFRRKYPRWWFNWNLEVSRFTTRVGAYLGLLREEYPSTDEEQAVRLDLDYPDAGRDLNRWLPIVKWILAIPHYIVLAILGVGAILSVVIAWFAIIFTGRYPRRLFDYVVGVNRWGLRVWAYMWLLITDRYPPFSLK